MVLAALPKPLAAPLTEPDWRRSSICTAMSKQMANARISKIEA
jgi:hypothetical protein